MDHICGFYVKLSLSLISQFFKILQSLQINSNEIYLFVSIKNQINLEKSRISLSIDINYSLRLRDKVGRNGERYNRITFLVCVLRTIFTL